MRDIKRCKHKNYILNATPLHLTISNYSYLAGCRNPVVPNFRNILPSTYVLDLHAPPAGERGIRA